MIDNDVFGTGEVSLSPILEYPNANISRGEHLANFSYSLLSCH
ncbi:hypothetical protein NXV81_04885 [Bacteroides ovatus]|nr:hypothetical protein [Bacteroides ovatus]